MCDGVRELGSVGGDEECGGGEGGERSVFVSPRITQTPHHQL